MKKTLTIVISCLLYLAVFSQVRAEITTFAEGVNTSSKDDVISYETWYAFEIEAYITEEGFPVEEGTLVAVVYTGGFVENNISFTDKYGRVTFSLLTGEKETLDTEEGFFTVYTGTESKAVIVQTMNFFRSKDSYLLLDSFGALQGPNGPIFSANFGEKIKISCKVVLGAGTHHNEEPVFSSLWEGGKYTDWYMELEYEILAGEIPYSEVHWIQVGKKGKLEFEIRVKDPSSQ